MSSPHGQSRAFFEACYQASNDPWRFATSPYELERYRATLDALHRPTYRRGFEPGCSVGVLTAALAQRVTSLTACDIADSAVARARARCRDFPHVQIHRGDVEDLRAADEFDLIVFSELGYYFSADRLPAIARRMGQALAPGGELVAVHWLGQSADHLLHGDAVHELLADSLPCAWIDGSRHEGFRIDSWRQLP